MKLKNTTNIPDKTIRQYIDFVKPNNLPTHNLDVKVTNSSSQFCGKFYSSIKRVQGRRIYYRPEIIARITNNENEFPLIDSDEGAPPTRIIKLYYEEYSEKRGMWQTWRIWHRIPITKPYIARVNKENHKEKNGKHYKPKKSSGGYIPSLMLSREEAFIHVLAHEFRHFWQLNHKGKKGKVWGARGLFSDRDADSYAIRKVREWRRLHSPREIYPDDSLFLRS